MRPKIKDELAGVMARALLEGPLDDEPDNVVGGLFAIARALFSIADAISQQSFNQSIDQWNELTNSLSGIAEAIEDRPRGSVLS